MGVEIFAWLGVGLIAISVFLGEVLRNHELLLVGIFFVGIGLALMGVILVLATTILDQMETHAQFCEQNPGYVGSITIGENPQAAPVCDEGWLKCSNTLKVDCRNRGG